MGHLDNSVLSNDNESFDASLGGWGVNANCTLTRDTTTFNSPPASMKLTATAAGGFSAILSGGVALIRPSTTFTVGFRAFSTTAGLSCQINIDWYTAGGVSATFISSATTTAQAIGTSTWTRVSNVVTSPPNAGEARFSVGNATAGAGGVAVFVDDVEFRVAGDVNPPAQTGPSGFSPGWVVAPQSIAPLLPVQATPVFNNGNTSSTPSGVTATITCASSRAHSLMVLVIHLQSSTESITSVTDNLTSTWVKAVDLLTTGSSTSIWYLDDSPAGITSVSATMTAGTSYNGNVSQWTSVSGLRGVNTAVMTTSPNNSGLIAALTGDLVIGGISSNSGTARTVSPPTSELSQGALPASWTGKHGYFIPSADGSYELDWTTASAANTGGVVAVFAGLLNPIATGTTITLTDAGSGSDDLANTATAAPAESGAAADALTATVTTPLADTGTGADVVAITVPVALTDAGSAADAVSVAFGIGLIESGAGSDAVAVTAATPLTDTGSAADALAATAALPLTDAGSASDLGKANAAVPVTEAGAAADALAAGVPIAVADTGSATDALTLTITVALTDTGSAADICRPAVAAPIGETAAAADQLAVLVPLALAEAATAIDALSVLRVVALADTGAAADAVTVQQQVGSNIALTDSGTAFDRLCAILLRPTSGTTARPGTGTTARPTTGTTARPTTGTTARPYSGVTYRG